MRLNKILFLIFLVLYLIAGLSLLITGSVAHRHALHYAEITGHSIISGAGFIIALGVIIIGLSILGFMGANKNRLRLLKIFICTLSIIVLLEFIAAIVGFSLRNKADDQLRHRLYESLPTYAAGNSDVRTEWDRLQQQWTCCGVNGWNDWIEKANLTMPPGSCCLNNDCSGIPKNTTTYFDTGCYDSARRLFFRYSKAIGGVSLFYIFIEIVGLILASVLLRDLKNNYGSV